MKDSPQLDDEFLGRLGDAVSWSRYKLQKPRERRWEMVREYAGDNYGDSNNVPPIFLNFLDLAVTIFQRQLVPSNPAVMFATKHPQLVPVATDMQVAVNHQTRRMKLDETLKRGVVDALFGMAFFKVGVSFQEVETEEGWTHKRGEPFCDLIDFDDIVFDVHAKRWDQLSFIGHRYRMPVELAKNSSYFDPKAAADIVGQPLGAYNERGDERIHTITTGAEVMGQEMELEEMFECWEIYLPRQGLQLVFPATEAGEGINTERPLRVSKWVGVRGGPYRKLGFIDVPGQILTKSPMANIFNLHKVINELYRKQVQQAREEKTVFAAREAGEADRFRTARQGQVVVATDPTAVVPVKIPGNDPGVAQFIMQAKMFLEYIGGNFPSTGGLGPQSETLGQDKLIHQAGSNIVREMQGRVMGCVREIYGAMAEYWWMDPEAIYEAERTIPGTDFKFLHKVKPEDRQGEFVDLNFDIDPFSMQDDTPETRFQTLMLVFKEFLMPLQQAAQAQGMDVALEPLLRLVADLKNWPYLNQIVQFQTPPTDGGPLQEAPTRPAMPASTERTYTRKSEGQGPTQQGQDMQMIQSLAAMGRQQQPQGGMPGG